MFSTFRKKFKNLLEFREGLKKEKYRYRINKAIFLNDNNIRFISYATNRLLVNEDIEFTKLDNIILDIYSSVTHGYLLVDNRILYYNSNETKVKLSFTERITNYIAIQKYIWKFVI